MGCEHSGKILLLKRFTNSKQFFIVNSYIDKSKNLVKNTLEELQMNELIHHITNKHNKP